MAKDAAIERKSHYTANSEITASKKSKFIVKKTIRDKKNICRQCEYKKAKNT